MDRHIRKKSGAVESRITVEDWLTELANERKSDTVPAGWYSIRQIVSRTGGSLKSIENLVARKVTSGEYEERKFRIMAPNGRVFPIKHFRKK